MEPDKDSTRTDVQKFHEQVYLQADKLVSKFLIGFFVLGLLLNFVNPSWSLSIVAGSLLLISYYMLRFYFPAGAILRYSTGVITVLFFGQFFLQTGGVFQIQFVYFIGLAVLLLYENWKVLIAPLVLMLVTLTYVYFNQDGLAESLPKLDVVHLSDFLLNVILITAFSTLCMYWAEVQRRQTEASAQASTKMEEQLKTMKSNISFANEISRGNLKADYPSDDVDKLGESLLEMRESLVKATVREEEERFYNSGLAQAGDILRRSGDNIDKLSDEFLQFLVKYVKANQGSLFVVEGDDKDQVLSLKAMYAWERKKYMTKTVEFGSGLVGQVALEKQTVLLTKLPKDYVQITSGLGTANPNCLVIVPLKSEEDLVGVVELASFHRFTESEIIFIEKVSESIASVILSARTSERTKRLLESTSQLTEQLRSQEEEIRQNMEEMQATQEEMARTQKELARKAKELQEKQDSLNALINNTEDSIIAMDRNYKIIIMNDVLRRRYKGTQYEGLDVGADALEALGAVRDEWKEHYDRALNGEKLNFTIKSSVKGEDTFREYFINPMKDSFDKVIGLSVFSRDVTANHRAQLEMLQKGSVLESIINHESDTYFAIDKSYKIIVVNEVLKNRFRTTNIELKEGDSILDLLPAASLELWKDRYDRAIGGEGQRYEEERKVGEKTLFLEVYVDPIRNKSDNIIGCSVVSRDISQRKRLQDEMERLTAEVASLKK